MENTNAKQNATIKLGCRFTPAESRLLDMLATSQGISTSSYFRQAVKERMLEDFLKKAGHHSNVRTASDVVSAEEQLEQLLEKIESEPD